MLTSSDFQIVKKKKDTPGGTTYYVILHGEGRAHPTCLRKIHKKEGYYCGQPAGKGTDHVGYGACSKHGGLNNVTAIKQIRTGKNAVSTRNRLAADIQMYLDKDRSDLLDLTKEFATLRAVLDEFMDFFPDPTSDGYHNAMWRLESIVNTLGTLVDKMSRIENRNTLTVAQVMYLRATIVDIFMKYMTDPDMRDRAVKELASRMGGDLEMTLQPSEYSLPGEVIDGRSRDV